jgi:hypothetical protein
MLPERGDLWDASFRTLAYKPERRFVAALNVGGAPRGVLKIYSEDTFEQAWRNTKALVSARSGALRIARRIGRSRRHCVLVTEWLDGTLFSEAISRDEG